METPTFSIRNRRIKACHFHLIVRLSFFVVCLNVGQWVHHGATMSNGQRVSRELVQRLEEEELEKIRHVVGPDAKAGRRLDEAHGLFDDVALSEQFVEFLTLPAYAHID